VKTKVAAAVRSGVVGPCVAIPARWASFADSASAWAVAAMNAIYCPAQPSGRVRRGAIEREAVDLGLDHDAALHEALDRLDHVVVVAAEP
jgi:hypothetical protein